MDGSRVILAAHRGEKKYHPENTMPAFKAAYEAGVEMIETDIRMTRDGELIVMHDRSALRTCGVDCILNDMTLEEVRKLDAGCVFSEEFRGKQHHTHICRKLCTLRHPCSWHHSRKNRHRNCSKIYRTV